MRLFVGNPFDSLLHNHPLNGKYEGCRSINVTGDYRIIYTLEDEDTALLLTIGTHSELYGK